MRKMDGNIHYETLRKVMEEMGKDFVEELKHQLKSLDKIASGDLINSINYKLVKAQDGWIIEITSDNYLQYVDKGRKPGKMPPSKKLIPWVESRGIKISKEGGGFILTESVAYLIARSIGKKGIKPTHIIENTRNILIQKYNQKIKDAMSKDYIMYIKSIIV